MDYKKLYDTLIERARTRVLDESIYSERHHIIPKCLSGTNEKSNIVRLVGREHFLCHMLLHKIYKDNRKLLYALNMMMYVNKKKYPIKITSKQYQIIRAGRAKFLSETTKGIVKTQQQKDILSAIGKKRFTDDPSTLNNLFEGRDLYYSNPENKRKHSEKLKKFYNIEENRITNQLKMVLYFSDMENRKKQSIVRKNYFKNNPEASKIQIEKLKKYYGDPVNLKKNSEAQKKYHRDNPNAVIIQTEKLKKYYSNPENRKKSSDKTKEYFKNNPDARKRCSEERKLYYSNPDNLKKNSEAQKKYHRDNPTAREQISIRIKKYYSDPENKLKNRLQKSCRKVSIDGKVYPSISEASRTLNIASSSVSFKCNNTNFPNYTYI